MLKGYEELRTGLIGEKLGHSFSPQIHARLGDHRYELFEMQESDVGRFLRSATFDALNVTIPYKKTVIPFLSSLSDEAKKIGAVNTVVRHKDGSLRGDNTDYYGFSYLVEKSGIAVKGEKVLILGSGGASNTAVAVMRDMGAREVVVISRSGEHHYGNLDRHADAAVIVNTTPVGMYPNNGNAPLSLSLFPHCKGVIDVIYNPAKTALLLDAEARGISFANGLSMLVAQAKRAVELFTGEGIPDAEIDVITEAVAREARNIVLVGMPGCGKSTVARHLARITGRPAVDTDEVTEALLGRPIPDVIRDEGEDFFRRAETEAARSVGKRSGHVIATGGGIVTRRENYASLRENSVIVWLRRDVSCLATCNRPLSKDKDALLKMYETREPMYREIADAVYDVCESDFSVTANQIAKELL